MKWYWAYCLIIYLHFNEIEWSYSIFFLYKNWKRFWIIKLVEAYQAFQCRCYSILQWHHMYLSKNELARKAESLKTNISFPSYIAPFPQVSNSRFIQLINAGGLKSQHACQAVLITKSRTSGTPPSKRGWRTRHLHHWTMTSHRSQKKRSKVT